MEQYFRRQIIVTSLRAVRFGSILVVRSFRTYRQYNGNNELSFSLCASTRRVWDTLNQERKWICMIWKIPWHSEGKADSLTYARK